jgi:hypothetical protein
VGSGRRSEKDLEHAGLKMTAEDAVIWNKAVRDAKAILSEHQDEILHLAHSFNGRRMISHGEVYTLLGVTSDSRWDGIMNWPRLLIIAITPIEPLKLRHYIIGIVAAIILTAIIMGLFTKPQPGKSILIPPPGQHE